jgi:hypothetical protein
LAQRPSGIAIHGYSRADGNVGERPVHTDHNIGCFVPPLHGVDDNVHLEFRKRIDQVKVADLFATLMPGIEGVADDGDPETTHNTTTFNVVILESIEE